ncbi:MAG: hypothetical protein GW748_04915 [Alphaproteobacteria bacterium]|nr:hypothetical protein [Alphaproteobacteria bacterium]NCQ67067.1 hypothetical protein [Alphaproteobacteria bacterium]NCT07664.1 hypothetical protein [Alphaproteobacteria bacterium]
MEKNNIEFYQAENGQLKIDVRVDEDTVWLTQSQMAKLFERDKSVISRHIKTIFETNELEEASTVAKNATVQKAGFNIYSKALKRYSSLKYSA